MKTNVELEFISKVRDLSEAMQELAIFWRENQEALEDTNFSKNYPTCESFDKLTLNIYSWLLTLINNYCEKDPIVFFDAYYKSLHK